MTKHEYIEKNCARAKKFLHEQTNPEAKMFLDSNRKRRKPVPGSIMHELILRCKGRCELCGLDFYKAGITPEIHHKDENPGNNKPSNLIVLCPNCHTKVQKALEKTKKTERRRSKRKEASPLDVLKEVEDSILDRLEEIDRKFSDLF